MDYFAVLTFVYVVHEPKTRKARKLQAFSKIIKEYYFAFFFSVTSVRIS